MIVWINKQFITANWLPVEWCIGFKIATHLNFKVLEIGLPPYLSQQLLPYAPTRGLRTSSSKLQVPRTNLWFGSRSFLVSAAIIWNSLPHSVRFCESLTSVSETSQNTISSWHSLSAPSDLSTSDSVFCFWHFINLLLYFYTYRLVLRMDTFKASNGNNFMRC